MSKHIETIKDTYGTLSEIFPGNSAQAVGNMDLKKESEKYSFFLKEIDGAESVFDIGIGNARFLNFALKNNTSFKRYDGVELVPSLHKYSSEVIDSTANLEGELLYGDFLSIEIPTDRYDAVIAMGSLVHDREDYLEYLEHSIRSMVQMSNNKVVFDLYDIDGNYQSKDSLVGLGAASVDYINGLMAQLNITHYTINRDAIDNMFVVSITV